MGGGWVNGCCLFDFNCMNDSVEFVLPEWPPAYGNSELYPVLSRWIVTIEGKDFCEIVNFKWDEICEQKRLSFSRNFEKNQTVCVTALPVTLTEEGEETCFFKCAGGIYPQFFVEKSDCFWEKNSGFVELTWERGFLASLLQRIWSVGKTGGYFAEETEGFVKGFNWLKLQQCVEQKMDACFEDGDVFYNPWLLDVSAVAESIGVGVFSMNDLNLKNVFPLVGRKLVCLDLGWGMDVYVLSSFIPENEFIQRFDCLCIKKNVENVFSVYNFFGRVFKGSSVKNVSIDDVFLPIYIDEYEKN